LSKLKIISDQNNRIVNSSKQDMAQKYWITFTKIRTHNKC